MIAYLSAIDVPAMLPETLPNHPRTLHLNGRIIVSNRFRDRVSKSGLAMRMSENSKREFALTASQQEGTRCT